MPGTLADGRSLVYERLEAPPQGRFDSGQNIPPEPDEVWEIAEIYGRIQDLRAMSTSRSIDAVQGAKAEIARLSERLGRFLSRAEINDDSIEAVSRDTAPSIEAFVLNVITRDSDVLVAREASNPNPLVVSIKGRGLGYEKSRSMRLEVALPAGASRSIPMRETTVDASGAYIEWVAPRPLSAYGVAAGARCSIIVDFVLQSDRAVSRRITEFLLG